MRRFEIPVVIILALWVAALPAQELKPTSQQSGKAKALKLKDNAPESVQRFIAGDRERKAAEIKRLTRFVKVIRDRISEVEKSADGAERTRREIVAILRKEAANTEAKIRQLQDNPDPYYPAASASDLRDGFIGEITKAKVKKVADGKNVLITVSTVKEKLPPDEEIVFDDTLFDKTDVWLTNYDTTRLIDGTMLTDDDADEKDAD